MGALCMFESVEWFYFHPVTYCQLLVLKPPLRSLVRLLRRLSVPQVKNHRNRKLLVMIVLVHYILLSSKEPECNDSKCNIISGEVAFCGFRKVRVVGGAGGNGALSFLSLHMNTNLKSLNHVHPVTVGKNGVRGSGKNCHGKSAQHTYIEVPVGTVFRDENGKVMTGLDVIGDYFVAARGGAGGHGNSFFASAENVAPRIAEDGALGEDRVVFVELRTMAHAGLIGFPNAGKSTFLRAISRARPKVSPYPFTTLNPHVGMVEYDDYVQVAVADIPGLIKDAHKNRGLGFQFLRHIERCLCLLYVLDLSVEEPWTQLSDLKYELEQYSPGLSERPHAVIGNKIDLPVSKKNLKLLQEQIDLPIFAISAKKGINITEFLLHLRSLYDKFNESTDSKTK
ncbi:LOW QUALITY PROTEIN: hypothetical protein KUTeg_000035 [Tegillarca granosa]|uniref:Mitochondrial ribosome-associated GTPase 2 n=1 Tax=Tegillarca granosa TaxID=220873 RepID=A0ABQ9FYU4_TEGGR|nr:LOW QUALITY PROTEIN: hypothetical protein KUTeg_000035 [Tegillarca granosa]